jgi:hypothetical protein
LKLYSGGHNKELVEFEEEKGEKQPKSNKKENKEIKQDFKSWVFGSEKNPELSGDFEIRLKMGQQKFKAWFNVPFLVQIAHLSTS